MDVNIFLSMAKRLEYYVKMVVIVIGTMTISTLFIIPYIFFRPKDYRNGLYAIDENDQIKMN